jgi:hypothetical protein
VGARFARVSTVRQKIKAAGFGSPLIFQSRSFLYPLISWIILEDERGLTAPLSVLKLRIRWQGP